MKITRYLVCLLALSGSVWVLLSERDTAPVSIPLNQPIRIGTPRSSATIVGLHVPRRVVTPHTSRLSGAVAVPVSHELPSRTTAQLSIPMTFEPNVGQADDDVEFIGRGKGLSVLLTRQAIAVQVAHTSPTSRGADLTDQGMVTLRVAGANQLDWAGDGRLSAESNYFLGNVPNNWHTRVQQYERAETSGGKRGVGIVVYGSDDGVEYDLRLAPGTDPTALRLTLTGARDLRIDAQGDLLMNVSGAEVRMKKPKVYQSPRSGWHASGSHRHRALGARRAKKYSPRQTTRSRAVRPSGSAGANRRTVNPCIPRLARDVAEPSRQRSIPCPKKSRIPAKPIGPTKYREIDGGYVIEADGSIGFRIGPHDTGSALIVDPSLSVSYATFLGGSGADTASSIAVDGAGKIYVAGITGSTTFPGTLTKRLGPSDGPTEFFVAKIDPAQTGPASLIYLAFLGGGGIQKGGIIAVDSSGDVVLTGTTTASDYPVTDASTPTNGLASSLGNDVVVSEINPAGNALVFSTLFGGSGTESQSGPGGIALGPAGDVYIASDVQTTAIDSASPDLPVTSGAYQPTWDGQSGDAFFAVLTPPASAGGNVTVKYCTYLRTNSVAEPGIGGIAVDSAGNAYIAGYTSIAVNPFPVKNAIQSTFAGGPSDAFLMKIAPGGAGANDLVYATLFGGSSADEAFAVTLDSASPPNAYVTGATQSLDFPTNGVVGAYQPGIQLGATGNAFLSVISQNAITGQTRLAYSTYFGGSQSDVGNAVAVVAPNAAYVAGATSSWTLPWHNNLQPFNGAGDAFVAKFDTTTPGSSGLIYATPLGGTSPLSGPASATANGIAIDNAGHVYVAGTTTSGDFPTAVTTETTLNGFQSSCASCGLSPALSDAFAAEIVESSAPMPSVYFDLGRVVFNGVPVGTVGNSEPVAVLNGGDANLAISNIAVSGPNASDFSLATSSNCFNQAVSPGSTVQCSFDVNFAPSTGGPEDAVVLVSDNAPGSPQKLEIVANGQAAAATASPTTVDFGNQPENLLSQPVALTLSNTGTQLLTITNIIESGPDVSAFGFAAGGGPGAPACGLNATISPGMQCVAKFTFDPNALRTFNAQVQFSESAGQNALAHQTVPLTGVGVPAAPLASLSQQSLAFANEIVGSASGPQTVSIENLGSATLNLSGVALAGANTGDFTIVAPPNGTPCTTGGATVPVQASCAVAVQFAPQTPGSKSANLVYTDNAAPGSQQVSLFGTATAAATLQVSPPSLTFPAQSTNTTSTPQAVTIANSGGAATEIGAIAITGPNAGDFSAPSACTPNPVAAGRTCQINVSFAPQATTPGIRTATLNVPTATPPVVTLIGTATQAAISVPTAMNFGSQFAGGAGGTPQPVVVTNSSFGPYAGTLAVTSVTKAGANSADFAIASDSCTGANTVPGSTCSVQVAFKPLPASTCGANGGARSASLSLSDNAPGSPHAVPLGGTATDFCISTAPIQPVVEPIAAGQSATYMLQISSSAGFSGSAALSCAVPANLLGGCAITTTPATNPPVVQVASNSPGQLQVVVTTTADSSAVIVPPARRFPQLLGRRELISIAILVLLLLSTLVGDSYRSHRLRWAQVTALVLASALLLAACGGGGGTPAAPVPGTPSGTYTIILTATVSTAGQPSVSHTFPLSLTVQ